MATIVQYLHSEAWIKDLHTSIRGIAGPGFWVSAIEIVIVNSLLSSDNALVIAMVSRGLPRRQRFWAMVLGLATSAILFIIFAALITMLMGLSYVRLGGGLVLLYIAAKLLVPEKADGTEVEAAAHLWRAARLIAIADIIMSLDNIIAVAAVARGNFVLLAIGVAMSVPIMLLGAILIAALLERFAILVWAGAALLGWIAGGIIVADPVVSGYLSGKLGNRHVPQEIEFVAAGAGAVLAVAYGLALRRLGKLRLGAATASRGR